MKKIYFGLKGRALPVAVGGGVVLAAALLTRFLCGSPLWFLRWSDVSGLLPPLWLLSLLWMTAYVAVGCAAGYLFSCPAWGVARESHLWRGSTFLILAVVVSLVWYTLLFGKHYLLPSWLCLPVSASAAGVCGASWWRLQRAVGCVAWMFGIWQTVLFFLQLAVLLRL